MNNIKDLLIEARNHCVRYGTIVKDESWEAKGSNVRETVYKIEGLEMYILMRDGEVVSMHY